MFQALVPDFSSIHYQHSFAADDEFDQQKWDGTTFSIVHGLFALEPTKTHVKRYMSVEMRRPKTEGAVIGATNAPLDSKTIDPDTGMRIPWFHELVPGFKFLGKEECTPHGAEAGYAYETVCFNAPEYLKFLVRIVESLGGSVVSIPRLQHVDELLNGHPALDNKPPSALFLCVGIGARTLGGIEDTAVYPTRGQVVLVKSPEVNCTSGWIGEWSYGIPRGDGTVILGGTYQADDWNVLPDDSTTEAILKNARMLPSELSVSGIKGDVVRAHAGLRPTRKGGIRIDAYNAGKTRVVTSYGHGGYGYQSSWGSCLEAVNRYFGDSGMELVSEEELTTGLKGVLAGLSG